MQHERLRTAREGKGWSVEALARQTGLRARTIELIDNGAFAELPAGVYCRSSIRTYASAVGLEPDAVLESLRHVLPVPEDALDGLARLCGHARRADARAQELVPALSAAGATPGGAGDVLVWSHSVPGEPQADRTGRQSGWARPVAAAAVDGMLLAALGSALVWLTARTCDLPVAQALRLAGPAIALLFAVIVSLYFVILGGLGNVTLGGYLVKSAGIDDSLIAD